MKKKKEKKREKGKGQEKSGNCPNSNIPEGRAKQFSLYFWMNGFLPGPEVLEFSNSWYSLPSFGFVNALVFQQPFSLFRAVATIHMEMCPYIGRWGRPSDLRPVQMKAAGWRLKYSTGTSRPSSLCMKHKARPHSHLSRWSPSPWPAFQLLSSQSSFSPSTTLSLWESYPGRWNSVVVLNSRLK